MKGSDFVDYLLGKLPDYGIEDQHNFPPMTKEEIEHHLKLVEIGAAMPPTPGGDSWAPMRHWDD